MPSEIIDITEQAAACGCCATRTNCIFGANLARPSARAALGVACHTLRPGEQLYAQGTQAVGIYFVKSGTFKQYFDTADGLEQIAAFHFPGDVIGLDAMCGEARSDSVEALDTAAVCAVSAAALESLGPQRAEWWRILTRRLAAQVRLRDEHLAVIAQRSARERIAWFLHRIARGLADRGFSARDLVLTMSRCDIANYLAMAVETVSRVLGDLERDGVLEVDRRRILIRQPGELWTSDMTPNASAPVATLKVAHR